MTLLFEILMVALMVFGFGFVVFFHELGHFIAAKWVGIRVEQFAVGFGQALFAWRKGIGWRVGSTTPEYRRRAEEKLAAQNIEKNSEGEYADEQITQTADQLGLGETEYRLNWIPLGGYVKMLGQDDLKPNATATDPRAYNRKGVGQRMIVVSAGVIMNIILAAIGFVGLFLFGFNVPPPIVGSVRPDSPAMKAGIQVGDRIVSIDGTPQYDFTRIGLTTALLREEKEVPVVLVRHMPDGATKELTVQIRPARMDKEDSKSFLGLGIGAAAELRGPTGEISDQDLKDYSDPKRNIPDSFVLQPNEQIVAISGQSIDPKTDFYKLDQALQRSDGKPVTVTIRRKDGSTREAQIAPDLEQPYGNVPLSIAGLEPRPEIESVLDESAVLGKLLPGDVITAIEPAERDRELNPDHPRTLELINGAGAEGRKLNVTVLRDGKSVTVNGLEAKVKVGGGKKGFGVGLGYDTGPVVSRTLEQTPARAAGIPDGSVIQSVDGKPVSNWFEVRDALAASPGAHKIVAAQPTAEGPGAPADYTITLTPAEVENVKLAVRAGTRLQLQELKEPRKANGVGQAINWGVIETRDFILQFYVTLTRMFQGRVSYTNMMGPVGIVTAGARFAFKGFDWLIWFLAMISANLAVVNFLPIPIVDGGLFTFLIVEKIQGKPISPRTQAVAQVIGFAVIISVFLLVTFQDIKRSIGM